jgi:hypothetical protein
MLFENEGSAKQSSPRQVGQQKGLPKYEVVSNSPMLSVIDSLSDVPASSNGRDFVGLRKSVAKDLAEELDRCETEGVGSPLL